MKGRAHGMSNIQDRLLDQMRKERILVTVFMATGVTIRGYIAAFDPFIVLLIDDKGRQQLIFKHAISSIQPMRYVDIDTKQPDNRADE
jgi:host factor-I protein